MLHESTFDRRYDAIVVGARPAGAATAMLLAQAGRKVLVVDRQAYGSDTLSTHALMRGAVIQLERWGLLNEIVKAGTPPIRSTTFHYGDEVQRVGFKPDAHVNALFAPRRYLLDRVIVDGAREAGVQVHHGARMTGLSRGPGNRVDGATIVDRNGTRHDIAADIVIGADGRHSTVARMVGASVYRRSRHRTATVYGHFTGLDNQGYRWFYRPGVSAGAIPTNNGATGVFVSLSPDRFAREIAKGPEAVFESMLDEVSPAFAEEVSRATRRGHLHGFPGEAGYFRQSFGPGWALVGDAGYFKDPITAHGITDALRDAEILASAAANGSDAALRDYQASRDDLSTELFEATDAIAAFDWDIDALKIRNRRLSRALTAENVSLSARAGPLAMAA